MKKILILIIWLFYSFETLAVVQNQAQNHVDKTKNKSSFIASFFSAETLLNIALIVLVFILVVVLIKFTNSKLVQYIENSDWEWESKEELIWVISRVLNITFLVLWTAIILGLLGIDIWIFMWGFGFGLGFTLKIFLTNFIGWIIMVTQNSYHNWDLIKIGDKMGYIRKINSLFTVVEQFNWVVFFVPNVKFLEEEVYNFHTNSKRRIEINIWVDYETDLLKAKKVILQVLKNFEDILKSPEPEILITEFKDSAININVRFWIYSKWQFFTMKSNVTETINLAFKQAWIKIPFPQITLSNRKDFSIKLENNK